MFNAKVIIFYSIKISYAHSLRILPVTYGIFHRRLAVVIFAIIGFRAIRIQHLEVIGSKSWIFASAYRFDTQLWKSLCFVERSTLAVGTFFEYQSLSVQRKLVGISEVYLSNLSVMIHCTTYATYYW